MKIWLDTAVIEEIQEAVAWGVVDGVTTNPTLMYRAGVRDFKRHILRIVDIVQGPVSAEVISTDAAGMIREAEEILSWSEHVVVKIPTTPEGLKAMKEISSWPNGRINATLIFSVNQALLAAKAGATYVSPFIGRVDDAGLEGMDIIRETMTVFQNYGIAAQIVTSSVRHPRHVAEAAKIGAHIVTMPYKVLAAMVKSPFTDVGLQRFLDDWAKVEAQWAAEPVR